MDENELQVDEEEFIHYMHVLINFLIDDEFEMMNKLLSGQNIAGVFGLNYEKQKKVEEEFDPLFFILLTQT